LLSGRTPPRRLHSMVGSSDPAWAGNLCVVGDSAVYGLAEQTYGFLMTILAGGVAGLIFDLYRVARSLARPRQVATAVTDLLYWIVVTPIVFALLLAGNWGELRFYVLIGLGVGLLLYFQALSPLVVWSAVNLAKGAGRLISALIYWVGRAISLPFVLWRGVARGLGRVRPAGLSPAFWGRRPAARMAWQRISLARFFGRFVP